ncbi:MAG: sugar ABC transporter permease [Nitrososphaerota archaeon]
MVTKRVPLLLQAPSLIIIWSLVGYVLPWLIFASVNAYSAGRGFVFTGADNYIKLLFDSRMHSALIRSFYYSGLGTLIEVTMGLLLALALINAVQNEKLRLGLFLIFLIPITISEAVVANLFNLLLTPPGYLNSFLRASGLNPVNWLSVNNALPTLIFVDVWQWTSLPFLLIYASRMSIPKEFYELAALERLPPWKTFRVVTWPHIKWAVGVSVLLRLIFMNMYIDKIIILTYGGPGLATETLGFYVFLQSFQYGALGYAATLSVFTLIFIALLTYAFWRLIRRGVD